MAATFSFSTTTISSGHAMRIYSTSLNWATYIPGSDAAATLTITPKDNDLIFTGGVGVFTKELDAGALIGDFYIDVTAYEMFGVDEIIPDDILIVKIDIANDALDTFSTDEVFYYNSWKVKSEVCLNAVNNINEINSLEIKYACMVNTLYQGLMADIVVANTTGIYEKFDIFKRLAV